MGDRKTAEARPGERNSRGFNGGRCYKGPMKRLLLLIIGLLLGGVSFATSEPPVIGSKVMPKGYVRSENSTSPDGKYGFIHYEFTPSENEEPNPNRLHNYLVALDPFQVLSVNVGQAYFHPGNHRDQLIEWNTSGTAALLLVKGKWGTIGATLFELRDGAVTRRTDLLDVITRELRKPFTAAKVKPYNDFVPFVIDEDEQWDWDEAGRTITIEVAVATRPNLAPGRAWEGNFKGTWNIPAAKWTARSASGKVVIHGP
jgi:hypothetical protein